MTNKRMGESAEHNRRASDVEEARLSRWRFSRTISLDSLIVLVVTIVSGLVFLFTIRADVNQQGRDITYVQKSLERVELTAEARASRLERDQAERSIRLELAIKEQNKMIQDLLIPRLQR